MVKYKLDHLWMKEFHCTSEYSIFSSLVMTSCFFYWKYFLCSSVMMTLEVKEEIFLNRKRDIERLLTRNLWEIVRRPETLHALEWHMQGAALPFLQDAQRGDAIYNRYRLLHSKDH